MPQIPEKVLIDASKLRLGEEAKSFIAGTKFNKRQIEVLYANNPKPFVFKRLMEMAKDVGRSDLVDALQQIIETYTHYKVGKKEKINTVTGTNTAVLKTPWVIRQEKQIKKFEELLEKELGGKINGLKSHTIDKLTEEAKDHKKYDTYHSTTLEGYQVTPEQVEALLSGAIPEKQQTKGEGLERIKNNMAIVGYSKAFDFVLKKAEADFYAKQGLENEAIKIYETIISACPGNEEIAQKLRSLKPTDAQTTGISIEKIHEEATASQSGADDDLQALFERFEKSDEGTVDYDAHYTTGLEFKQKGLLDEAIKELRIAAGDQEKKQRNSTMLALCYMEKGSYPLAIAEFNKIIDKMAPSDSTYLHVKYELANAHMNNKDYGRALELFSEVQEYNPDFKDVSGKVDSLKAQVIQTAEERPKPKRDRVSYI